jgi:hypothetical protein
MFWARYREEARPFPPIIDTIYFQSLDMRLLLNILTETKVQRKEHKIIKRKNCK